MQAKTSSRRRATRLTGTALAGALAVGALAAGALAVEALAQDPHDHPQKSAASYPDLAMATPTERAQARRLLRRSKAAARARFPSYRAALRAGYAVRRAGAPRPHFFHVRSSRYARDRRTLDARRPEALVYWRPRHGRPVLTALMFRVPSGRTPDFGGPILAWHTHASATSSMTHVWLTNDVRTAYARCAPTEHLAEAIRGFHWESNGATALPEVTPCP